MKKFSSRVALIVALAVSSSAFAQDPTLGALQQDVLAQGKGLLRRKVDAERALQTAQNKASHADIDFAAAEASKKSADKKLADAKRDLSYLVDVPPASQSVLTKAQDELNAAVNALKALTPPFNPISKSDIKAVERLALAKKTFAEVDKKVGEIRARVRTQYNARFHQTTMVMVEDILREELAVAQKEAAIASKKFNDAKTKKTEANTDVRNAKTTLEKIEKKIVEANQSAGFSTLREKLDKVSTGVEKIGTGVENVGAEIGQLRIEVKIAFAALTKSNEGIAGEVKKLTEKNLSFKLAEADAQQLERILKSLNQLVEEEGDNEDTLTKVAAALERVATAAERKAAEETSAVKCIWNGCQWVRVN
jgi:chromosome segregation ATPase